ncbi:ANKY2 protein, partial [Phaetusa simplex]|nr:ANKY2 protein [Phaetusa simplex]
IFSPNSGNKEITWMMLEAGAETDVVNSVGRTAAQMAAFVGKVKIYYDFSKFLKNSEKLIHLNSKISSLGLPFKVRNLSAVARQVSAVHTNSNATVIVLLVKENPLLAEVEALQKCYRVLDLICEKCMKQKDMNEVLAMKMHYISCIFQKCITFLKEREDKLDGFIKSLLKGRDKDGFPVYQEKLIRESIRKFPYCEATLLQQLVRSIAPVEI